MTPGLLSGAIHIQPLSGFLMAQTDKNRETRHAQDGLLFVLNIVNQPVARNPKAVERE